MTDNPFHVGSRITDSRYFVGRHDALCNLADRVTQDQPTNVNLVGARRIGKSSVLGQFCRTAEQLIVQRGKDAGRYVVVYLSLRAAQCQSRLGFYRAVARVLLGRPVVASRAELSEPLNVEELDQMGFRAVLERWQGAGVLPVVCLDEIEECFESDESKDEFNDQFFDNLRALTEAGLLVFVVASRESLRNYGQHNPQLSTFPNVFSTWELQPFTVQEVDSLMAKVGVLPPNSQYLMREWGGSHPYRLQLAGDCLWQAQQYGKSIDWAKRRFEREGRHLVRSADSPKLIWRLLYWLGWEMPQKLGSLVLFVGGNQEGFKNWLAGVATLGLIVFILIFGKSADWDEIKEWLELLLG